VTPRQRIVLLLIAAVVLAGGIVLAASGGDDEPEQAATTNTAPPAEPAPGDAPGETQAEADPPPAPKPRVESIRMRGRAPVGEPKTFEYQRGDTIRLRFVSDVAEEVHIHGYDLFVQVPAGGTKTTRFKADAEGIFEIEAHSSGELLAKLEVRP
jgi:hypothetical protein